MFSVSNIQQKFGSLPTTIHPRETACTEGRCCTSRPYPPSFWTPNCLLLTRSVGEGVTPPPPPLQLPRSYIFLLEILSFVSAGADQPRYIVAVAQLPLDEHRLASTPSLANRNRWREPDGTCRSCLCEKLENIRLPERGTRGRRTLSHQRFSTSHKAFVDMTPFFLYTFLPARKRRASDRRWSRRWKRSSRMQLRLDGNFFA